MFVTTRHYWIYLTVLPKIWIEVDYITNSKFFRRDFYLLAYNSAIIDYVLAVPSKDAETGNWLLRVFVYLNPTKGLSPFTVELELETDNGIRRVTNLESTNTQQGDIWSTQINLLPVCTFLLLYCK